MTHAPLSFAQERLWLLHQLAPQSPLYNVPTAVRLHGQLDAKRLAEALAAVVARQDVLRTTYTLTSEGVRAAIGPANFALTEVDLAGHDTPEMEARQRANDLARVPFDLERDAPLHATLFRLAADEHLLLLVGHHIALEAWSIGVLLGELSSLYSGQTLPALPLRYAELAARERAAPQSEAAEADLAYWRNRLSGELPLLRIPADRRRPAVPSYRGGFCSRTISGALPAQLRQLARQERLTSFMLLLSAYAVLLQKYSRQDDLMIGIPVSGRDRIETEPLIGMFINTLALRLDVRADCSWRQFARQTRRCCLEAFAHQTLSFEQLICALQITRHTAHSPVFQAMFSMTELAQSHQFGEYCRGTLEPLSAVHSATSKMDLSLFVEEHASALIVSAEYATDVFAATTIERLLRHYETLLAAIAAHPDGQLRSLSMLDAEEEARILGPWNDAGGDFPRGQSVVDLFEKQAQASPDAVALVSTTGSLSYAVLERRANALATRLIALGIEPEARVAVLSERCPEAVIAFLAILKAGAAYVPIDPDLPRQRLLEILGQIQPQALIARAPVAEVGGNFLALDDQYGELAQLPAATARPGPKNLAYVMFTSGSSGQPKGVCIEHRAIVRLVRSVDYVRLDADTVTVQLGALSFDASTFEIWAALLNGGRVVLPAPGLPSVEEIAAMIAERGINTAFLTTALFNEIVRTAPAALEDVAQLLVGGEANSAELMASALRLRRKPIHCVYGPTENTTFSTSHRLAAIAPDEVVPIGSPISGSTAYVLDDDLRLVPPTLPGELYTGGDGVARGYLRQPAATAERFVPDPFGPPGARLYRTGDIVRQRLDGTLEFLGRDDAQVKIRGYRIELEEVEAALRQLAGVAAAAVAVVGEAGDKRLAAYIVSDSADVALVDLKHAAAARLPSYMLPTRWRQVEALPLTAHGKVDRRRLARMPTAAEKANVLAPESEVEQVIAAEWCAVLQLESVGLDDNFFDLGGHSLLLMRLHARLRERLVQPLTIVDLFRFPTVRGQASFLAAGAGPVDEPRMVARESRLSALAQRRRAARANESTQ